MIFRTSCLLFGIRLQLQMKFSCVFLHFKERQKIWIAFHFILCIFSSRLGTHRRSKIVSGNRIGGIGGRIEQPFHLCRPFICFFIWQGSSKFSKEIAIFISWQQRKMQDAQHIRFQFPIFIKGFNASRINCLLIYSSCRKHLQKPPEICTCLYWFQLGREFTLTRPEREITFIFFIAVMLLHIGGFAFL